MKLRERTAGYRHLGAPIRAMLHAAQERRELDDDVAVELLAAVALRRVMLNTGPIDETLRADIDTLIRHPPRRP